MNVFKEFPGVITLNKGSGEPRKCAKCNMIRHKLAMQSLHSCQLPHEQQKSFHRVLRSGLQIVITQQVYNDNQIVIWLQWTFDVVKRTLLELQNPKRKGKKATLRRGKKEGKKKRKRKKRNKVLGHYYSLQLFIASVYADIDQRRLSFSSMRSCLESGRLA